MSDHKQPKTYRLEGPYHLHALFQLLQAEGYRIAGPKLQHDALIFDFLDSFDQIPVGYRDIQEPGHYRLRKGSEASYFGYSVGPQSLKGILHPSRRRLMVADQLAGNWHFHKESRTDERIALFGIRACDLQALQELDKVFLQSGFIDEDYASRRRHLLVVTATCIQPSAVCFCTSMGEGPRAKAGYDMNLTEVFETDRHYFLAQSGSERGAILLSLLNLEEASPECLLVEEKVVQRSRTAIRKNLDTEGLAEFLKSNLEHPLWGEIGTRCLSCANCTMVCPTCFCSTVEDVTDLKGHHTERWLRWDSCFTADFSLLHGGVVRSSTPSRYRNWLVHKLSTWHDQFQSSGCVGCGRCITWCPVGIDLTQEIQAMREKDGSAD